MEGSWVRKRRGWVRKRRGWVKKKKGLERERVGLLSYKVVETGGGDERVKCCNLRSRNFVLNKRIELEVVGAGI